MTSATIGLSQPRELAGFDADLPGWPVTASDPLRPGMPEQAGWAQIKPPTRGTGPTVNFEYERCFQRPVWPAEEGRQTASQHLDIHVDDLAAAVNWAEFQPQDRVRVMIDPDGHPFCLFL